MTGVVLRMFDLPFLCSLRPFRRIQKISAGKEHINLKTSEITYRLNGSPFHFHRNAAVSLALLKVVYGFPIKSVRRPGLVNPAFPLELHAPEKGAELNERETESYGEYS